jgi:hypothetical protein
MRLLVLWQPGFSSKNVFAVDAGGWLIDDRFHLIFLKMLFYNDRLGRI